MSFRYKLGKIEKKHQDKYKHLNYDEVCNLVNTTSEPDFSLYSLPEHSEFLIIDLPNMDDHYFKTFFNKFNLDEYGYEFKIMTKEGLEHLIDHYNEQIISTLNSDIEYIQNNNEKGKELAIGLFQRKLDKWKLEVAGRKIRPYILNKDNKKEQNLIISDDSYEYDIFNLVFIYNNFNWDNDYLILNGW